jgi:cytochrome c-type biogenesis protein CcmH/NrfG
VGDRVARRAQPAKAAAAALEIDTTTEEQQVIRRARKRLKRRPNDARAHLELGRALFAQERGAEALPHLEQACRLRPAWLDAHLLRAFELHWQGRWREAEAAYRRVLALEPTHAVARRGLLAVRLCQPPDALLPNDGLAAGSVPASAMSEQ